MDSVRHACSLAVKTTVKIHTLHLEVKYLAPVSDFSFLLMQDPKRQWFKWLNSCQPESVWIESHTQTLQVLRGVGI